MTNAWLQHLGARIRARRRALGQSQEDLAGYTQLHATYISHLENGRRNVSFVTLVKLAHALDWDAKDLVDDPHWKRPRLPK